MVLLGFDCRKTSAGKALKLLSGSCYLPHPDKEDTGGEDAHFICVDEQAIGVADGVGGWADLGVDSGQYSRELMSHSVTAVKDEPKGSIDPARVLEKAHSSTKAKGSSTACILALTDEVYFFLFSHTCMPACIFSGHVPEKTLYYLLVNCVIVP
jgi:protein phosphatase PTC7